MILKVVRNAQVTGRANGGCTDSSGPRVPFLLLVVPQMHGEGRDCSKSLATSVPHHEQRFSVATQELIGRVSSLMSNESLSTLRAQYVYAILFVVRTDSFYA